MYSHVFLCKLEIYIVWKNTSRKDKNFHKFFTASCCSPNKHVFTDIGSSTAHGVWENYDFKSLNIKVYLKSPFPFLEIGGFFFPFKSLLISLPTASIDPGNPPIHARVLIVVGVCSIHPFIDMHTCFTICSAAWIGRTVNHLVSLGTCLSPRCLRKLWLYIQCVFSLIRQWNCGELNYCTYYMILWIHMVEFVKLS